MILRRAASLLLAAGLLAGCTSTSEDEAPPPPQATPSAPTPGDDVRGSAGCGQEGELRRGVSTVTTDADGTERTHLVYAPPAYDGTTPLPVLYLVHGLGGQAALNLQYTGLATVAEERGFLVVAPQALGPDARWDFRAPVTEPGSDLAYLRDLMDDTAEAWCVDEDRQQAAGISNGSAMVFAMACSGAFPLQGYGGVAATFYDAERCVDAPAAGIVYFHGTADTVVPFDGGPTPIEPVRPTPETLAAWAEQQDCRPTPRIETVAEDVERRAWRACREGARLEAYVVQGGGHTWPGSLALPGLGRTTASIDASRIMADFFGLTA